MDLLRAKDARDYVRAALEKGPRSIRRLSQELGYSSDRGLGMVLKGQRTLSAEAQARLARFLKLTVKERAHLQTLVQMQKQTPGKGRAASFVAAPEISSDKHLNATSRMVASEALHPLVPHYSFAILDILRIKARALTAPEIAGSLRARVPLEEIESALTGLVSAGFLKAEKGGYFRCLNDEEYVQTSSDIPSQAIRAIHRAQLARGEEALESESVMDREFIAKTLIIPRDQVSTIKRLLREKLEELAQEIALEKPTQDAVVSQVNLQFFLQTK